MYNKQATMRYLSLLSLLIYDQLSKYIIAKIIFSVKS